MKIGPKFKIAKRLGAPIFEKTQTQKFALSEARRGKIKSKRPQTMSDFKRQLIEKQKMRFTYGITERQLERYVTEAVGQSEHPIEALIARLELRLDNVAYRLGLAKTRRMARQLVSHGHVTVNGIRMTIPSYQVKSTDVIAVREGSKNSVVFANAIEKFEPAALPQWLKFDVKKMEGGVVGSPRYDSTETLFDPEQVLEYYSR